ncbi:hypothetical protein UA32_12440 [Photobacterium angustum]|uniref:Uncharacterized protein n=1 Tax=Photobacterium angustum TaxID=661 RepID=A0ABX5H108_PHOAN|nr:hypothetical protein [Photobacterium angustum]KJG37755.1 hypothetical protein UA32_12440 [Photobacterium angustum]PSX07022.1 hypothetical protein C0W27_15755 [Photobacterium angustum]
MRFNQANYTDSSFAAFQACDSRLSHFILKFGVQEKSFEFEGYRFEHVKTYISVRSALYAYEYICNDTLYRLSNFWSSIIYTHDAVTVPINKIKLVGYIDKCHWKLIVNNNWQTPIRNKGCDLVGACTLLSHMT